MKPWCFRFYQLRFCAIFTPIKRLLYFHFSTKCLLIRVVHLRINKDHFKIVWTISLNWSVHCISICSIITLKLIKNHTNKTEDVFENKLQAIYYWKIAKLFLIIQIDIRQYTQWIFTLHLQMRQPLWRTYICRSFPTKEIYMTKVGTGFWRFLRVLWFWNFEILFFNF